MASTLERTVQYLAAPLRVTIRARDRDIPEDERTRMQDTLAPLRDAVQDLEPCDLWIQVIYHANSDSYHVEFKFKTAAHTLMTGDWDRYMDSAYQRCVRKMVRKVQDARLKPARQLETPAERVEQLNQDVVAPEGADEGPLGKAVQEGDYRAFREAAVGYEDWLRKRIGRWIQRSPDTQARVGRDLLIGDLVEEVYLNAFERYETRSADLSFSRWLEDLIDPSLKAMLRHPDEEHQNASFARTLREM